MKKRRLSEWLGQKGNLSAIQIRAILLELTTRLEVVELERSEDIGTMLDNLCTCVDRVHEQRHEDVCPQHEDVS